MLGAMTKQLKTTAEDATDQSAATPADAAQRTAARSLFWQGWRVSAIAAHLGIKRTTLHGWKKAENWDATTPTQRVEGALEARLVQLIAKGQKTGGDFKEIDLLGRQIERLARVNKYNETGRERDLNPAIDARNAAPRRNAKRKNWFSERQIDLIREQFMDEQFNYQRLWYGQRNQRTRMVLKSRQIGATYYFAHEALLDAIDTGRNELFLSASKSQSRVFKQYIINLALNAAEAKLTGEDLITLGNGAELRFLGTNSRTAQSYHGNLYFDEFFWVPKFQTINKVARGMTSHKQYRRTYCSTPSVKSHEAYPFWTGEEVNRKRKEADRIAIDLSDAALRAGTLSADRVWRQRVTIHDAAAGGCDLFDIHELRNEYSPDEFANLYECEFIDDSEAMFTFTDMQACMVDADLAWPDFRPYTERPFARKPVWLGHDAGLSGHGAGLVIVAPPDAPGGKFRILERQKFRGASYEEQAQAIRKMTVRYNVEHLAIDVTGGYGAAVHELVDDFYPQAKAINYNLEMKERMVLKGRAVVSKHRLEIDAGDVDVARAFMAIKRTLTKSQKAITYETGRTEGTGHGELAWATLNVLINEPLDEQTVAGRAGFMEIFE